MIFAKLPNGFQFTWTGNTARIDLPPFEVTESHEYEPVLSQRDAEMLADAVDAHDQKRRRAGAGEPLQHVRLARDARYSREALAKFRGRLSVAFVERGQDVRIDEKTTMSGTGVAAGVGVV